MNFLVKEINITNQASYLLDNHPNRHVDFTHGFILFSSLVLLPLVNSFRNAKTTKVRVDYWSKLPLLARFSTYIIIITIVLPTFTIFGTILLAHRTTVELWLRLRHKDKFKGLLSGPDTLWTLEDRSTSVVNILLVVRHQNSNQFPQQVIKKLKEIRDDPELWKLRCGYSSCMGYSYLLMNEHWRNLLPCVRKLDSAFYANREVLQATLSELASVEIAGGNLWETFVGVEEIAWGNKTQCYPLIVRFHHVLGDGLALLQLVQKCFSPVKATLPINFRKNKKIEHDSDNDLMQQIVKITIRLMHSIMLFYKLPETILKVLTKENDKNCLHDNNVQHNLTGEKIITWKVENGYKYVNRVKQIKRRIGGASFMDVIAASISYSFNKLFKFKNSKTKHINAVIPALPHAANFVKMNTTKKCVLTNRFSVGIMKLPITIIPVNKARSCYWRCAQTIANLYDLRTSFEFQFNYWMMNIVMGLMPCNIMKMLLKPSLGLSTLVISNLPGPRRVYLDEGYESEWEESFVEDIVFWVPQRGLTGVSISIFTYDDRFQLGLCVDRAYGVSSRQCEDILESIFEYIDRLHDELCEDV